MEKSTIEILFQDWLNGVKDGFAYILTSAECASRHAFEAGYNTARKNNSESPGTTNNSDLTKLLCDIKTLLLDVDTPTREQRSDIVHRIAGLDLAQLR
jgi:hypothetical protein